MQDPPFFTKPIYKINVSQLTSFWSSRFQDFSSEQVTEFHNSTKPLVKLLLYVDLAFYGYSFGPYTMQCC